LIGANRSGLFCTVFLEGSSEPESKRVTEYECPSS
jgi:hypothetical protein